MIFHKLSEKRPRDYETVLAYHEKDLFPVCAFCMDDGTWLREIEGPEDTYDFRSGKHERLYRYPTHWAALPDLPMKHPEVEELNRR